MNEGWDGSMDKIEAKKNLESYKQDRTRLQSLNHLYSTEAFKQACAGRVRQLNVLIGNLEGQLKGG